METYGDAEGLLDKLYESFAGLEEGEIFGIVPSNSPLMHLVHHNDACVIYFPPVVQTHLYKSERKSLRNNIK